MDIRADHTALREQIADCTHQLRFPVQSSARRRARRARSDADDEDHEGKPHHV
jgi:hypothetical protein